MSSGLDLSLFKLPTSAATDSAEAPISSRPRRADAIKQKFWAKLARRINLAGEGSLVDVRPYGLYLEDGLSDMPDRLEGFTEAIENRGDMTGGNPDEPRELGIWQRVQPRIKDVTPQFFLRNISRLERDVDVTRTSVVYAVWKDMREVERHFTAVRYPAHKTPELIEDLSTVWVRKITREIHNNVVSWDWAEEVPKRGPAPTKIHPMGLRPGPVRIPVDDLNLEPAPANRVLPEDRWEQGIRELMRLQDSSKDDE